MLLHTSFCLQHLLQLRYLCASRHLLYGSWDFEEFRAKHLAKFLGMTEEWETSAGFPQEEEEEGDEDLPRPVS